jgi:hypothetical protein
MAEPARILRPAEAESWLEIVEADSPLLLIAPHGGHAESRTRAILHPKVNDLHTADITRALARRSGAAALINHGIDRNRLDCNRIAQIAESAPWLLDLIAQRLAQIVARHGRATVLLIHGWNIIEPRVDFGLGLRNLGGELRPTGAARVSASDQFIHGPLAHFESELTAGGIKPSFGMRYPAGGAQNLLQAFTPRYMQSDIAALRSIATIAEAGNVDAIQLEFSVACRMPGPPRERCLDAMESAFAPQSHARPSRETTPRTITRVARPRTAVSGRAVAAPMPTRVGIELYDAASQIGAMASFDLGPGGLGGRIMMLLGARSVALFTGEGRVERTPHGIALGPLRLEQHGDELDLTFDGPAVIVPDSTEYLSIERALASGRLDPAMRITTTLRGAGEPFDLADVLASAKDPARTSSAAALASFGKIRGAITVEGTHHEVAGFARAGASFTGLGPTRFSARRMLWACFETGAAPLAMEMRLVSGDDGEEHRSARLAIDGAWRDLDLHALHVEAATVEDAPHRVEAEIAERRGDPMRISGQPRSFIPLSRPGLDGARIYTALGFARFDMEGLEGAGMFEYSRRSTEVMTAIENESDDSE